ncbi:MAG: DUF1573 domain-containing protein [Tannerellaceae bacterium]
MKRFVLMLVALLSFSSIYAQNGAVISVGNAIHDFGIIEEKGGPVAHEFIITNVGKAPLVINRVTASCGCTTPEWTKSPIAPGKTGVVKATYNPAGRPGPFNKTISVYSNGKQGAFILSIKGTVVTNKPDGKPMLSSIGNLKMSTNDILFNIINPGEVRGERISVQNGGNSNMTIQFGSMPNYLNASVNNTSLGANETGEITILYDGSLAKTPGRIVSQIPVTITQTGKQPVKGFITVRANVVNTSSKLTAAELANAPKVELSTSLIDLGTVSKSKSKASRDLSVSNSGKSPLMIYSLVGDDDTIEVTGGKKEIKPGQAATFKVTVDPKGVTGYTEKTVYLITNDPKGPVRMIRVYVK